MRRTFMTPAEWDKYFGYSGKFRVLKRRKLGDVPGTHEGLQLPDSTVVHLGPRGVEHCSFEEFLQGQDFVVARELDMSRYAQVMMNVQFALSAQWRYHAVDWNCERFVRWLLGEPADSPQVTGWFVLAVAATAIAIAARA